MFVGAEQSVCLPITRPIYAHLIWETQTQQEGHTMKREPYVVIGTKLPSNSFCGPFMKLRFKTSLVACIIMAGLLAGCGGGGSGSAMVVDDPPTGDDSGSARVNNIQAAISQIAGASDSVLVSDVIASVPVGGQMRPVRLDMSCATDSCTARFNGIELIRVSVSEFETLPPYIALQRTGVQQGVPIVKGSGEVTQIGISTDMTLLGGWLDHSLFAVQTEVATRGTINEVDVAGLQAGYGYSIGNATGTNPVLADKATWRGGMVGASVGSGLVRGDATLTLDVGQMAMDVTFTNIHNVDTGHSREDMTWGGLAVTNGTFGTGSQGDSIQGRFYGPNHEEVGGIFERARVVGAFGARR
jgi:hypothetical protein